jgi:replicative DNA helicase
MSYEAQKALIGSLLLDSSCIEKVYQVLSPEKFSDEYLGKIYYEIKKAYDNGNQIDVNILSFKLGDIVGINTLLAQCLESVVTSTNIEEYADIINKEYKARRFGELINVNPNPETIMDQIQTLETELQDLQSDKVTSEKTIEQLANECETKTGNENVEQGINTGFESIDKILQGMDDGDVSLIGARPAVGKTAFALNVAMNIAKSGKRVEFFSLEMSELQIYQRLLAIESELDLKRIRRAIKFNDEETEKFKSGNAKLKSLGNNLIINCEDDNVSDIGMSIKRNKVDIAIIDYLQLIKTGNRYKGNRYAEVGEVSRGLKSLAKKLNIPIVALCQLNRTVDEFKEPSMNELRESGDFEQDASQIILAWNKNEDRVKKGFKICKNRNSELGTVELEFDGKVMKFIDSEWKGTEEATPFD